MIKFKYEILLMSSFSNYKKFSRILHLLTFSSFPRSSKYYSNYLSTSPAFNFPIKSDKFLISKILAFSGYSKLGIRNYKVLRNSTNY